jgi:hypothetical protein
VATLFIVFSLDEHPPGSYLVADDLVGKCFLPKGLFDRLLCILLDWSQRNCGISPSSFTLGKNVVVMQIANVSFRLVWRQISNCIELNTVSASPITLLRRLENAIKRVNLESAQSLYIHPYLLMRGPFNTAELGREMYCLIPARVDFACSASYKFKSLNGVTSVDIGGTEVVQQHPWLSTLPSPTKESFEVFISHRWGDCDDELVSALFDRLSDYVVNGSPISIFYDSNNIKVGDRLDKVFFRGLNNSAVVVPVVSINALQRMLNHNSDEVDCVLVEWLAALVFVTYPSCFEVPLRALVPLLLYDSSGYGYFSVSSKLPVVVPLASCKSLLSLFRHAEIMLPTDIVAFIQSITVKVIVDGVMKSYCVSVKMNENLADVVTKCTSAIIGVVLQ